MSLKTVKSGKKKSETGYLVLYTFDCTPKIKAFGTKWEAVAFGDKLAKIGRDGLSDSWADHVIKGEVVQTYKYTV